MLRLDEGCFGGSRASTSKNTMDHPCNQDAFRLFEHAYPTLTRGMQAETPHQWQVGAQVRMNVTKSLGATSGMGDKPVRPTN
jgi:hypothetical protein